MTRPALSELHSIRRSMQKRLAFYMITLAILLAATLVAGLFFFDQLKSPREGMVPSRNFRMEAFASDMESLWRNVSVMGVHLSEDMTDLIEERTADFSALRGDADAMEALQVLRDKFGGSELFAHEKDESFKSTMGAIYQTFGGRDLYPSVEEKAANLLYLTVKNHSFSDGNKRIAAFLFLWFLENNRILYRPDGSRLLDNNTLVALTLMIAESRTEEKDVMTKVVVNLINKNN